MMSLMCLVLYKRDNNVSPSQDLLTHVSLFSNDDHMLLSSLYTQYQLYHLSTIADSGSCDRPIDPTNQNQYIVWGIGSLGETAFQHHTRATGTSMHNYTWFIVCKVSPT